MSIAIRRARPTEYETIGELTAHVYVEAGFVRPGDEYLALLGDAATRGRQADLLVAVDSAGAVGAGVVGSVTYAEHDSTYAELSGPGEAEFRMLVVHPQARKRGVGVALVQACIDRARRHDCRVMRLSSGEQMTDAHRLYERLGFRRTPERDWRPEPDVRLRAYALTL